MALERGVDTFGASKQRTSAKTRKYESVRRMILELYSGKIEIKICGEQYSNEKAF